LYTVIKEFSTKSKHLHGNYEHLSKYIQEITKYSIELPKYIKKVLSYFISQLNTNTTSIISERRFVENSFLSSSRTGIDEDIIKHFQVILFVISSGYRIYVDKFKIFTLNTAKYFVYKYPWYAHT